jgi:regulator of protease activity HflC (stomatin/prohibitin superfamily)
MVAFPWSLDVEPPPTTAERKRWRFFERHLPNLSIGLMALMLVAAVLYPYMVITVPSGHVGVLWKRFNGFGIYCWCWVGRGTVLNPEELRGEGLHLIWPWNRLFIYDLRLQNATETYNAISKEGVSLSATINIRFQLRHNSVAVLHKFIGPGYERSVVSPEIGSRTREVMAQYTAEQIYSTSRQAIEDEIRKGAERRLSENLNKLVQPQASEQADMMAAPEKYTTTLKDAILIIDTLVLGIELPAPIVGAINRKIEQYYLVQEYTYRVEREMKESERKQIEANGIHAFQQTVSQGISDSYLRWRGIEATLALAQSTNSKIVIVGGGKDGLPIILGNVDAPAPAAAPPAATPPAGTPPAGTPPAGTPPAGTPPAGTPPAGAAPTGTPPPATEGAATPKDKSPAAGAKPPAAKPEEPGASTTLKWSDLEAIISRLTQALRPTGAEAPAKPPSEKPAAEAPR